MSLVAAILQVSTINSRLGFLIYPVWLEVYSQTEWLAGLLWRVDWENSTLDQCSKFPAGGQNPGDHILCFKIDEILRWI